MAHEARDYSNTMCNPSLCDPSKWDCIWREACDKELTYQVDRIKERFEQQLPPQDRALEIPSTPGELVLISGILRRPELNGMRGKVVDEAEDAYGRVVVHLNPRQGKPRRMRIQRARLTSVSSTPALPPIVDEGAASNFGSTRSLAASEKASRQGRLVKSSSSQLPIVTSSTGTFNNLKRNVASPAHSRRSFSTFYRRNQTGGFYAKVESN
eukprot:gnl/MRDRNA2_/MRDRNA2_100143_c0_seq1.p1 gnl/MRDRNA2_/MRDRNA2_100143_c0~~gnl/MRDRNA2_/MRDRNA2_100143_c0_seq1.p1  ORF type:complete len:211 (-),score=26.68 gnl/MRDRNA2_/MRDRNA2_100143_c0_seq1:30-662(-)